MPFWTYMLHCADRTFYVGHTDDLETRIAEMQAMADTLRELSHCCAGDDRPDCPILADLARVEA